MRAIKGEDNPIISTLDLGPWREWLDEDMKPGVTSPEFVQGANGSVIF